MSNILKQGCFLVTKCMIFFIYQQFKQAPTEVCISRDNCIYYVHLHPKVLIAVSRTS